MIELLCAQEEMIDLRFLKLKGGYSKTETTLDQNEVVKKKLNQINEMRILSS